jgi:hypothetical protein
MTRVIANFPDLTSAELRRRLELHARNRAGTTEAKYRRLWSIQVLSVELRRRGVMLPPLLAVGLAS